MNLDTTIQPGGHPARRAPGRGRLPPTPRRPPPAVRPTHGRNPIPMMSIHCPRHGGDVLVSPRQIVAIDGRGADMTVRWVCACGHHGTHRPQRTPVPA